MNIKSVKKFREYADIEQHKFELQPPVHDVETQENALIMSIFAPDEVTGLPRSDIQMFINKNTDPQLAEFIKNNLLVPLPQSGGTDADTAMSTIADRHMDAETYVNKLKDFVKNNQEQEDSNTEE